MDFSNVFKLDDGSIDRYKKHETDILTTCSEKALMAIWSQKSNSILVTSYAKINRKAVPQFQKLVTNPIVEDLVTNISFNCNGDYMLLASEHAVFYVSMVDFNEGDKSIMQNFLRNDKIFQSINLDFFKFFFL